MKRLQRGLLYLALVGLLFTLILGEEDEKSAPELVGTTTIMKVVDEESDEEEMIEDITDIEPGTVLLYRHHYENVGDASAHDAMLITKIPEGTYYLQGHDESNVEYSTEYSADNGETYSGKPVEAILDEEGNVIEEKEISPEKYTHIKWIIDEIAPSDKITLSYRVKVCEE